MRVDLGRTLYLCVYEQTILIFFRMCCYPSLIFKIHIFIVYMYTCMLIVYLCPQHPSNSRIFFYGDDDVSARLALLDEYLSHFNAIEVGDY